MTVSRRCDQVTRTPEGTLLRCAATMVPALALSTRLIRARKLWNTNDGAITADRLLIHGRRWASSVWRAYCNSINTALVNL